MVASFLSNMASAAYEKLADAHSASSTPPKKMKMTEKNPLDELPRDVLIQEILLPQLSDKNPEKFFISLLKVDRGLKSACNTEQMRSALNLSNHLVFDSEKPIRYIQFILDCADMGNKHACLIYAISMGFCFNQPREALKYLGKIWRFYPAAEYAYSIFKLEDNQQRSEGMALMKRMKTNPIEDYIDKSRISLLRLIIPGLHLNYILRESTYKCTRLPGCTRHDSKAIKIDGEEFMLTCSDKAYAAREYNVFAKAFVWNHLKTIFHY